MESTWNGLEWDHGIDAFFQMDSLRFLGPLVHWFNSWVASMASFTQKTSPPGILMNSRLDWNVKRAHEWLETKTEYDFVIFYDDPVMYYSNISVNIHYHY